MNINNKYSRYQSLYTKSRHMFRYLQQLLVVWLGRELCNAINIPAVIIILLSFEQNIYIVASIYLCRRYVIFIHYSILLCNSTQVISFIHDHVVVVGTVMILLLLFSFSLCRRMAMFEIRFLFSTNWVIFRGVLKM